nr:MAG TPA: hypothetical protein [Caudoviricetes sp.]
MLREKIKLLGAFLRKNLHKLLACILCKVTIEF